MINLKLKSSLVIAVLMLFLNSCNSGDNPIIVGGPCDYEDFTETFRVDNIEMIGDTIEGISFVSIMDPDFRLGVYENEVDKYMKGISQEIINDTSQLYIISGEKIISGACTPIDVFAIKLKQ